MTNAFAPRFHFHDRHKPRRMRVPAAAGRASNITRLAHKNASAGLRCGLFVEDVRVISIHAYRTYTERGLQTVSTCRLPRTTGRWDSAAASLRIGSTP